mmetsp:Transcript_28978/g.25633  ORF Transcript_28978/g.25633 Transcript_28978/m.25633 type:complete len:195 (+) Transcript_28978:1-585(+)
MKYILVLTLLLSALTVNAIIEEQLKGENSWDSFSFVGIGPRFKKGPNQTYTFRVDGKNNILSYSAEYFDTRLQANATDFEAYELNENIYYSYSGNIGYCAKSPLKIFEEPLSEHISKLAQSEVVESDEIVDGHHIVKSRISFSSLEGYEFVREDEKLINLSGFIQMGYLNLNLTIVQDFTKATFKRSDHIPDTC